jgi:hypothetical protein
LLLALEVVLIVVLFVIVGLVIIPVLEPSVAAPLPSATAAAARGLRMRQIQPPTQDGRKVVLL